MPDASSVLLQRLQAAFDTVVARCGPRAAAIRPGRLPGQRRPAPGQGGRPAAAPGGRGGRGGGLAGRHLLRGGGQRPGLHQPDAVRRLRGGQVAAAVRRRTARRRAGGAPPDDGHRLLGAQRGQGDARRPPAQHAHRRRAGPCARLPRARRAAREPHRRLGDAVRHAHRAPARRRRGGRRRVVQRARPQRVLRRGAPAVRQRPGLRRALPAPRRAAAERRRRDAAPVADLRRRVACATPPRSTSCSACCSPPRTSVGESFYNPLLPVVVVRARREGPAGRERRGPLRVPRGLREPQRRAAPADRAQVRRRLRLPGHRPGQRARPHRADRRHPARLRRRGRAVAAPPPRLRRGRAGRLPARRRPRPSTSGSASSSGPTARSWPAARAARSASSTC